MLPVNCGSHTDYQNFVTENLRKYYPNPDALARSTWNIIEHFWHLDLSFTDTLFMIFLIAYGIVMRLICLLIFILLSQKLKNQPLKAPKPIPLKKLLLPSFFLSWKIPLFC